jgi:subtilisin family serine protease
MRVLSAIVCLALLGIPAPPAHAAPDPAPTTYLGAVTLLTGDRVSVRKAGDRLVPQVTPAPGRQRMQFAVSGDRDSLYVVPRDAQPGLNAGRLDLRLFDVAGLLKAGYDDGRRGDLPLIVRGDTTPMTAAGGTATARALNLTALRQPKARTHELWTRLPGTGTVWLDGMRTPSLDTSVGQIGAPSAWQAGYTGRDVTVAVLDTGIDPTHPDLRDRIAATKNFTADKNIRDTDGHGTHVAGTIAGTGAASDGRYTGVAPGARLLVGKVCQANGCPESAILAGMEWAATRGARVVNLSLGGVDTPGDDPLETAVDQLSAAHGTLFVIAAGNDGSHGPETVGSPATADAALAVGAVDDNDAIAGFSSRGPRVADAALKPEIVAPGVQITAARSRYSSRGEAGSRYTELSGTSMATPHVAGAAAILAQQHPDWTGQQLKAALMASAKPLDGVNVYEQGAGRVDVARAVTQSVHTVPAAVSAGRAAWPHEDDPRVTRTLTYRNPGTSPVTLTLTTEGTGPDGQPAPDGMFMVSTGQVTVPPGGHTEVDVTVDTAMPAAEGTFSGRVVATGPGGLRVVTPVAVDREPESYDLTLEHVDRAGRQTPYHLSFLWGVDIDRYRPFAGAGGVTTLRVRRGTYHVDATVDTQRPDGDWDSAKLARPAVEVAADTTLVMDARQAQPVRVTFDRDHVVPQATGIGYSRLRGDRALFTGVLGDGLDRVYTRQDGEAPAQEITGNVGGVWAVLDRYGAVDRSTVTYNLGWFQPGAFPTGFTRHLVDRDLARVQATYRTQEDRKRATKVWVSRDTALDAAVGFGIPFRLPLVRTEFHNTDGLQWSADLEQFEIVGGSARYETFLSGVAPDQPAGQTSVEEWNTAVFGPGFGGTDLWAQRNGDQLTFSVPLFSDSAVDRYGRSAVNAARTALYRDGVLVGETAVSGTGDFAVPEAEHRYRLVAQATRSGVSELSTRIATEWTFASRRPEEDPDPKGKGKGGFPLPLLAVRFAPPGLDLENGTRANAADIPFTIQQQAGVPAEQLTTITVETSANDGRTWVPAAVTRTGDRTAVAHVEHPRHASYISLRARVTDAAGNTVDQTIIRAYRT